MDTRNILSRRSLLKASPAAIGAALLPVAAVAAAETPDPETAGLVGLPLAAIHIEHAVQAMANPAVAGRWTVTIHSGDADQYWGFRQDFSEVRRAISLHKRSSTAYEAAIEHESQIIDALYANSRYDRRPRVKYGRLIVGVTPEGENRHEPLYAYSLEELDALCEQECPNRNAIWGAKGIERTQQRYADLKRDLARQLRRKQRLERKAGLTVARRATFAACEAEERAAVAVLLAKPKDETERAEKRRYIRGKHCFKADWWNEVGLMAAIKAYAGLGVGK